MSRMKTARENTGERIRWFVSKTCEGAIFLKKKSKEFRNGHLFTLIY